MNRRASSLAFHAIVKAAEVSAVSHHPSLRATWWGWYLCLYSVKNNFGEGLGHLRDTAGLQGWIRKLGNDPRNYSLPAIPVRSKLLPVERLDLVICTYASVGRSATARADHRVYDVMV